MAKHPDQRAKSRPRWIKGIWVGKSPIDDTHIVLTKEGAKTYRSIRRQAKEQSADLSVLKEVKGLPWSVKHGVRLGVKAAPEKSEIVVVPLSNRFAAFETEEENSPYGLDEEEESDEESSESVEQADAPQAASEAADTSQKTAKRVSFDIENIPIRKLLTEGGRVDAPPAASTSSSSTSSSSTQQPSMAVDTTSDRAVRAKIGDHVGSPPPEAALVKRPTC